MCCILCCDKGDQFEATLRDEAFEKFRFFLTGATRRNKIESLQRSLTEQQNQFSQHTSELKNTTHASFAVSELIGERMKHFTDGEYVKECFLTVVGII
ncbi:EPM2A-interacting protein 1-like [Oopsacas minuta]|uniref:EPM2A-interacting protein 1-like n=1 Tax=Oopsacas minuta TaxID=111878 RepID=A0AAV7JEC1_9METZ|nr:EPM2A-interacting protein 1-like [Oopsacas minuta]